MGWSSQHEWSQDSKETEQSSKCYQNQRTQPKRRFTQHCLWILWLEPLSRDVKKSLIEYIIQRVRNKRRDAAGFASPGIHPQERIYAPRCQARKLPPQRQTG